MYKKIKGFGRKKENIGEKRAKCGEYQEPRKIKANLSVFLAPVLSCLV